MQKKVSKLNKPLNGQITIPADKSISHRAVMFSSLAKGKSIINIYYHDEDSRERLINNITKIIGEEEVLAKVRMVYQHDPKRGILIPIEEK
jgi:5-enolpyruvylshikimate-3-phosphate synthase